MIIFTSRRASAHKVRALQNKAQIIPVKEITKGRLDLKQVMKILGRRGITHVLIEGGGETAASALSQKLVQECFIFIAPKIIGGKNAVSAVAGQGVRHLSQAPVFKKMQCRKIGDDFLMHGIF